MSYTNSYKYCNLIIKDCKEKLEFAIDTAVENTKKLENLKIREYD